MKIKITKNKIFTKICYLFIFVLFLNASPLTTSRVCAWDGIPAAIYHRGLDTIYDTVQGVILGALKQAAATAINQAMESIMGGGGANGGALFVQDYNNYLIVLPRQGANTYINDYISQTTKGRGSASGYISVSGGSEGFGGSYQSQLAKLAKSSTSEYKAPQVTYKGNPSEDMFSDGTLKNLGAYVTGINYPVAYQRHVEQVYAQKKQDLQFINQTKVQAGLGSPGQEKNGMVVTPGALAIMNSANAQDLGNKILAASTHPQEMITSVVSQIMTKALQNGIGNAAKNAMNSLANQTQANQGMGSMADSFGSGTTSGSNDIDLSNGVLH